MKDAKLFQVDNLVETSKTLLRIEVTKIRRQMGRLDEQPNVAKFMARMGQCFTQIRRGKRS
ncbi:hypothetical protein PFISCL1PPCAC_22039 [Pristionchus fissidentatus]|uniref:RNA-dependent RNA polymerase n=1 Tax=Pristionchus fissidentatus TaxID=1538716 RepID=A0AAV5WFT1_9BILA|nr:hypothetical protein PFISCL1PPCAC_22039 [Pristionchus fissidentatus]